MKRLQNRKLPRGVFVRDSEYWIRYTDQFGKLHREKLGLFLEPAKAAVEKRRSDVREEKFFPDKLRQRAILFGEIAKDYVNARRSKRVVRCSSKAERQRRKASHHERLKRVASSI